jgi:MFS family permease
MASLLIIGAIPSGLAGTVSTANGLYIVRFFIGILGGTFVSCQAWITVFFDKNVTQFRYDNCASKHISAHELPDNTNYSRSSSI